MALENCNFKDKDTGGILTISMRLQTAVTHGLGWPAGRLAGHHTDTAPKHSLLFQFSFRVEGHADRRTFVKWRR